jgi:hypothetical protein
MKKFFEKKLIALREKQANAQTLAERAAIQAQVVATQALLDACS